MSHPKFLEELAAGMVAIAAGGSLQAGYTYLGQLIAHDIVPVTDLTKRDREVTPQLNFDSLYGVGDYPAHFDSRGRFLTSAESSFDLVRDASGKALIPEHRNDENVLISQLHLACQRLHNGLVNKFNYTQTQAKECVVLTLQAVIVEDYLPQLLEENVYQMYFKDHATSCFLNLAPMPQVFSHAGFRFGHSMVRRSYELNKLGNEVPLVELFKPDAAVPDEHIVDWSLFFGPVGSYDVQLANRIDTNISSVMTGVKTRKADVNITLKNLRAGYDACLPSGVELVAEVLANQTADFNVRVPSLQPLQSIEVRNLGDVYGVQIDNLPLWPYLLLEARHKFRETGVESLGTLGSLIVADVLYTSISDSHDSYLKFSSSLDLMSSLGEFGELLMSLANAGTGSASGTFRMHDVMRAVLALEA